MRFIISLVLVACAGFAALALPTSAQLLLDAMQRNPAGVARLAIGAAGGALFGVLGRSVPGIRFLDTLCHELSHAAWAFLVGGQVLTLKATGDSGGRTHFALPPSFSSVRSFLTAIAPYWFCPLLPIAALILAVVGPLGDGDASFAVGALFGYALAQPFLQWAPSQPDLRAYGVIPPLIVAGWLWVGLFTASVAALTIGSSRGVHAVYVASTKTVGIRDADQFVRGAEHAIVATAHPRWLTLLRAASNALRGRDDANHRKSPGRSVRPES